MKQNKDITLWEAKKYNIYIYLKTGFPIFILLMFTSHEIITSLSISFIAYHLILLIFPIQVYHTRKGKHYLTKPTFLTCAINVFIMFSLGISIFYFLSSHP